MGHTTTGLATTPTTPTTIPIMIPTISPISQDPATTITDREDMDTTITAIVEERTAVPASQDCVAHAACWKHVSTDHPSISQSTPAFLQHYQTSLRLSCMVGCLSFFPPFYNSCHRIRN